MSGRGEDENRPERGVEPGVEPGAEPEAEPGVEPGAEPGAEPAAAPATALTPINVPPDLAPPDASQALLTSPPAWPCEAAYPPQASVGSAQDRSQAASTPSTDAVPVAPPSVMPSSVWSSAGPCGEGVLSQSTFRPLRLAPPPRWRTLRRELNHLSGIIFPMTAAAAVFGWRAMACVAIVATSAWLATRVWRRVGRKPLAGSFGGIMVQAVLLAFLLPAEWCDVLAPPSPAIPAAGQIAKAAGAVATTAQNTAGADGFIAATSALARWPLLISAGVLLAICNWLVGKWGTRRVHPLLLCVIVLFLCYPRMIVPRLALYPAHAFSGDLLAASDQPTPGTPRQTTGWAFTRGPDGLDAYRIDPVTLQLEDFSTAAGPMPWMGPEELVRDRLPPLEDLLVGGHPSPLGLGSAIAVVIGGLFLIYRGVVDQRLPMVMLLASYALLLVAPLPDFRGEGYAWTWAIGRLPGIGWALAVTLANYVFLAGPFLFTAFFLASLPGVAPASRPAAGAFGLLVAVLAVPLSLYVTLQAGPIVALALGMLVLPEVETLFRRRPLV